MNVVVGTPFDVELAAAPTTGYMWQLQPPPDGVKLLATDFEQRPDAAIGDGGTQVFRLKAEHPGHFELHFKHGREWESEPTERRVIEVDAQ